VTLPNRIVRLGNFLGHRKKKVILPVSGGKLGRWGEVSYALLGQQNIFFPEGGRKREGNHSLLLGRRDSSEYQDGKRNKGNVSRQIWKSSTL